MKLKELHNNNSVANGQYDVKLSLNDNTMDYLSKAVVLPQKYSDLFEKKGRPQLLTRRLAIVKITYLNPNTGNKASIWRECDTKVPNGLTKEDVALPFKAIWELGISEKDKDSGIDLIVKRGFSIPFFFRHPDHAARIATWIGAIGILLAIIGFIF